MGPDSLAMRQYIYSLIDWPAASSILDIGCGRGDDLRAIGTFAVENAKLVGMDTNVQAIEVARATTQDDDRYEFRAADASVELPFEDGQFDIVFSNNTLECIPDKQALLKEIYRVLRTTGQVIIAHMDFESQLIDGKDKAFIRLMVETYGEWKQNWMADHDGWMGRRLWSTIQSSRLFRGRIHSYVLTNTEFKPGYYGYERIQDFASLARRGMIDPAQYADFRAAIERQAERGEYFYSITMFVYVGRKI
jgi:ubiquinone/menaquinone biosynthesis C-methylase UbiE